MATFFIRSDEFLRHCGLRRKHDESNKLVARITMKLMEFGEGGRTGAVAIGGRSQASLYQARWAAPCEQARVASRSLDAWTA